jgi:hypothetical protein
MKKINTYKSFNESWEEEEEDENASDLYDGIEELGELGDLPEDDLPEDDFDSEMNYLCDTIQSLFDNSDLYVDINYEDLNITVFVFLEKVERMKSLTKAFDIANKLRKDILPQYESEFELYENKEGYPVICFEFTINENPRSEEDERNLSRLNARDFS